MAAKLLIKNIGKIVSGDLDRPILNGDAILVDDGKIARIGRSSELAKIGAQKVVDATGTIATPGLIDSHTHPVFGDFTPRQKMVDFIESSLHGGVTTMISAAESHLPGRISDKAMVKALAILAAKSFSNFRPGGVKVHGGSLILEPGLTEADFKEMAQEGVKRVGEIGLGRVRSADEAAPMVKIAKKYGMKVMIHCGGASVPGSSTITADEIIKIEPDVVSHINGGPTAISPEEIEKLVKETNFALEIVHCGNPKMSLKVIELAMGRGELSRVIIGNDAPSGTGVIPLGIIRTVILLSSLTDLSPEKAIALATGNTARIYGLDTGFIKEGCAADIVIMDSPMGSVGADALGAIKAGDIPGITLVIVDGEIKACPSRNTPLANRTCLIS